jgi:uncharacterized protein (UPF0210 family)
MKIRSITCFCNPNTREFTETLNTFNQLRDFCQAEIKKVGWDVQSTRLATIPFGMYTEPKTIVRKIVELEKVAADHDFTYLAVGPARISHPEEYAAIPEFLKETQNVFCSAIMTHHNRGISTSAVKACAKVITDCAKLTKDGFVNLRFCATSSVRPFTPFFPGSYSYNHEPAFALAMQCADAAIESFESASTATEGSRKLVEALNKAAETLQPIMKAAEKKFGIPFKGFDFSLAPYPEDWCSLGQAFEKMGISSIGYMGSLTAAALLTNALDQGKWKRTGYNGLMMPVLEDSTLAARSGNSHFTVKDLLLYSAVCGTGLDTVPLPGDVTPEMIEPLLMDICSLSLRLDKPLTARLMPVPGLKSGDKTFFNFDLFHNGQIMDLPALPVSHVLANSDWLEMKKRERQS